MKKSHDSQVISGVATGVIVKVITMVLAKISLLTMKAGMKLFQKTREPENKDNDQESMLSQHSQNAEKEMVAMLLCCSYNPNRNAIKNYLEIPH